MSQPDVLVRGYNTHRSNSISERSLIESTSLFVEIVNAPALSAKVLTS